MFVTSILTKLCRSSSRLRSMPRVRMSCIEYHHFSRKSMKWKKINKKTKNRGCLPLQGILCFCLLTLFISSWQHRSSVTLTFFFSFWFCALFQTLDIHNIFKVNMIRKKNLCSKKSTSEKDSKLNYGRWTNSSFVSKLFTEVFLPFFHVTIYLFPV